MATSIAMHTMFENDALQMVWNYIDRMPEEPEYPTGVVFEGGRDVISVWYAYPTFVGGRVRPEPNCFWQDLCVVMRLLEYLGSSREWFDVVVFRAGMYPSWTLYPKRDADDSILTFESILHRIDQIFSLISEPLPIPQ